MTGLAAAVALLVQAAAPRAEGAVVQATAARAYLDAGADAGLAAGAEVILRRGHAEVARCRLDAVAARAASCPVAGARAGDAFSLPPPPSPREAPRHLPPPPAAEALAAQAQALAAAPVALVRFEPRAGAAEPARAAVASVEVAEGAWLPSSGAASHATRASVSLHGAEVGLGLRLDVDAQAVRWWARSSPHFRPRADSQLYVWQASLTREEGPGGAAVAFGRVLPWRIPGATVLDGATAGWRLDRFEVGAFGGFVPDPTTLSPTADRATGGGFWTWDGALGPRVALRDEGRVAVVRSPELGTRVEAETLAAARVGRGLDLSGSLRFGLGGDVHAPGDLDAARLEVAARPLDRIRVACWGAYDGLAIRNDVLPAVWAGHARRAEASVGWEEPGLRVTALGGVSRDLASGVERSWAGPILDLPRLFARRGGLSVGYLEERGWLDGRSAWVQAVGQPWARLRLLARVSWEHASSFAVLQDQFGLSLSAVADLARSLSARLSVTTRAGWDLGGGGSTEGGATVSAALAGRY